MIRNKLLVSAVLILCACLGCSGDKMKNSQFTFKSMDQVPEKVWKNLSHKKIYFGHQSVGYNIIDGLKDIEKENKKIDINIVESDKTPEELKGFLAHSPIGENFHPLTKIEDFKKKVISNFNGDIDIAILKFCWVDINAQSNIEGLFKDYKKAIDELKSKYPKIIFVHSTAPLFQQKRTWKTYLKELIGKDDIWEFKDNIMRNKFNDMIRKEYEGKEPIFDIAKCESTYADGKRQTMKVDGKTYYSMVPEYTSDGGHLNEMGRKLLAKQFLVTLANLAQ